MKTYRVKLKPSLEQEQRMLSWIGTCRLTYNMCLGIRNDSWKKLGKNVTKNDLQKQITELRNDDSFPWYQDVHSQVLQDVSDRLFDALNAFFKRNKKGVGYPRFAKKKDFQSFTFKQGVKIHKGTRRIQLPKIGMMGCFLSQPILGEIKTCTIKHGVDGWFASIVCQLEMQPKEPNSNMVGIDLGLIDLIVSSDGESISNPRTLKRFEKKLKKVQQDLSRKRKGSKNFHKKVHELKLTHLKIKNIRKDQLHKITTKLVNENQVVVMEDLLVLNMMKNHKLAKAIQDASWGMLGQMLQYKCEWGGRTFIKVNPRNTTTDCHVCGHRMTTLTLADRSWLCPSCGTMHNRDENSSQVILNRGIEKLKESGLDFSILKYKHGDILPNGDEAEKPTRKFVLNTSCCQ